VNVEAVMFCFILCFGLILRFVETTLLCCVKVRSKLEKKMVVLAFCSLVVL